MMRKLLKYQLINGRVPDYIEDGGYFVDGDYLYGVSKVLDEDELPSGTTWVSQSEFEDVIAAANENLPEGESPLTREAFENNRWAYRYRGLNKDERLDAVELAILEMV